MSELHAAVVPDIGAYKDIPVIEWLVKVGENVKRDQGLLTLESDKATMEVPAPFDGVVRELKVKVGDRIGEGSVVAMLEKSTAVAATAPSKIPPAMAQIPAAVPAAAKPVPSAPPVPATVSAAPMQTTSAQGALPHASPAVRLHARELGVDLTQVTGSGRSGRISREDINDFVKRSLANPANSASGGNGLQLLAWPQIDFAKFGAVQREPLTRIQKLSGANLARNWAMIPHVTQHDEADITEMEVFRKAAGEQNKDVKVTPLVFLIKAVVAALQKFPRFNSSLESGGENLVLKQYFHIGIAVDTPDGLVVPVIRDCDKKGLLALAKELAEISAKARDRKLAPADMQGGCFSISSLGGIGGTGFTPIINAPEVAILGVSKAQTKPTWQDGEFVPKLMMPLSLSYDHRVIDGAAAARFTAYLAQVLGDIRKLLL
jgi:pyruvate dehydrogenase E2 component (dihydrolipoamide acetyltransferase)